MRDGRSSKTAEHNALFRALETLRSPAARPAIDPLAATFLSPSFRAVTALARARLGHELVVRFIDRRWPGVRASVVARTRLIDDLLTDLTAAVHQVVILGAGFDSRAHRLACLRDTVVIEVDHPATQARKRALLARAGHAPDHVRYAATDFQTGGLDAVLATAGYDAAAATAFLWEGVTNYLTADAVDTTLRWCSTAAAGSHLVFTYIDDHVLDEPGAYHGANRVLATSRRAGEQLTFGIAPAALPDHLAARGFALQRDVGAAEYRQAYLGDAASGIRGHEFYRVAHARVVR